jgi:hypothetical protein
VVVAQEAVAGEAPDTVIVVSPAVLATVGEKDCGIQSSQIAARVSFA